jgi:hypothetical protein
VKPTWLRIGLAFLAATNIFTGFWASVDPEGWWESFPGFGHAWIIGFGSYNEHLVRDVGGFFLAFGILFALAAIFLEKRFAGATMLAWLFFAAPHLAFHMRNRGNLSSSDNLLSLEALALEVAIPVILLILLPRIDFAPDEPATRTKADPDGDEETATES